MTLWIARVVDFAGLFANETQASDESIEDAIATIKQPLRNTPHSTTALASKARTGNTAKCDETLNSSGQRSTGATILHALSPWTLLFSP